MTSCFFLRRSCSELTEPDILLGIFENEDKAKQAKQLYLDLIQRHGDFHQNQAGVSLPVVVSDDVYISNLPVMVFSTDHPILVLCSRLDAMGSIFQSTEMLVCDVATLCEHGKCREAQEENESYQDEFFYDSLTLNELRFENHCVSVIFTDECENIDQFKSLWTPRYY